MMELQVSLNNKSFDRAGIPKDCKDAVCEYIWNGFEAGASKVRVEIQGIPLQEAQVLAISDNGCGIQYENLNETFGAFLSSIKDNSTIRIKSQQNKGKGRFSYLSFSHEANWTTVYKSDEKLKKYRIHADSVNKSKFETTEPVIEDGLTQTGTTVIIPIVDSKTVDQLTASSMQQKLLEEFAWFLYLNKGKNCSLEYLGVPLDVDAYINTDLSITYVESLFGFDFTINVVVWRNNIANSSKIYYLTEAGEIVSAQNTSFNKNTVNFYHAVFVSSPYFRPEMFIPKDGDEDQYAFDDDLFPEGGKIFRPLKKLIRELVAKTLKSFLIVQADSRLAKMEKDGNYPTFSNDEYGQLRKKDFETVTRELYCVEPKIFYKLNSTQEKSLLGFLNLLLSSEERENVLTIVEQIVQLTPGQRQNFADILQRSQLQYIVEAIGLIEKRIVVVEKLKSIVFDSMAFANERDHIQKLVEQHFWLFGEQYHILTADKNLSTSLQEYEKITESSGDETRSISEKEALQRIDIFLYSQRIQENNSSEMLIIELKAPHVKLTVDVFNQIVRYANTIRKEPRFASSNRTWRFFAICSEVDDDVRVKYHNFLQYGKKGLADIIENFEIYALSWDDIFQSFEARHSFMLDKLKLDYSQLTASLGFSEDKPTSKNDVTELTQKLLELG